MTIEESTRLFVGGLSLQLPEEELNQQLSNFGTVKKLEIKEKKDICTGEVIKRFAFATLDATRSRIDQCIRSLHGKSLHGSELTLERAQESFIDRLKREREARAQGNTVDKSGSSHQQQGRHNDYQFNFGGGGEDSNTRYNGNEDTNNTQYNSNEDNNTRYNSNEDKNTRYNNNEEDRSWQRPEQRGREDYSERGGQKRGRAWEEEEDKQKVPEELFPSPAWREDGEGGQGADESSRYRTASPPPQKWAKIAPRYDPKKKNLAASAPAQTAAAEATAQSEQTPQQQQQPKPVLVPTTVSADLAFTGASQGFSLLSMLEKAEPVTVVAKGAIEEADTTPQAEEEDTEQREDQQQREPLPDVSVPVAEKKQPTEVKTYIKKFKFFVDPDDPEVEENLRWVYQEIPEAQLSKFSNDRPDIMALYNDRVRKAHSHKRHSLPDAGGDDDDQQAWSGGAGDGGEAAVMEAYDNDWSDVMTLATDTLGVAAQGTQLNEKKDNARGKKRGSWYPARGGRGGRDGVQDGGRGGRGGNRGSRGGNRGGRGGNRGGRGGNRGGRGGNRGGRGGNRGGRGGNRGSRGGRGRGSRGPRPG